MPDTLPATIRWSQDLAPPRPRRPGLGEAVLRGARGLCPVCGQAPLFAGWLKPVEHCTACATPLAQVRADDAPPYVVVFIVGHLMVGLLFALDGALALPVATELAIFLPLTMLACLALLRPAKGAVIGLMLRLGLGEAGILEGAGFLRGADSLGNPDG